MSRKPPGLGDFRRIVVKVGSSLLVDAGGEPVVVAVADFRRRHGVVLVDDRHRAPFQKLVDGRARIEIAPPLLGVLQGDQHLPGRDAMARENLRPDAGEGDLADRGGGLAVFQLELPGRQPQHRASERDGA